MGFMALNISSITHSVRIQIYFHMLKQFLFAAAICYSLLRVRTWIGSFQETLFEEFNFLKDFFLVFLISEPWLILLEESATTTKIQLFWINKCWLKRSEKTRKSENTLKENKSWTKLHRLTISNTEWFLR